MMKLEKFLFLNPAKKKQVYCSAKFNLPEHMKIQLLVCFWLLSLCAMGQPSKKAEEPKKHKGTFYFAWGYNKDWFSKSDLHFEDHATGNYDFTLYNVKADDRPNFTHIFDKDISIPQYIYRIGYYFNDRHNLGVEIGFDHAKYVMIRDQAVHIKGTIHDHALDQDTVLRPSFLAFEHTNGANFLMVSLLKRTKFFQSKNQKHVLNYVLKPGIGMVIPKTDVTLFGKRRDNVFHVAGYILGIDTELRYEFGKHLFAETGFKGCFANYTHVLTIGDAKANHHFFSLEYLFSIGYGVPW
jgi:hypothetical protein